MKKPTLNKVKKLLEKNFGWENLLNKTEVSWISDELIEDTISVMMELIEQNKKKGGINATKRNNGSESL